MKLTKEENLALICTRLHISKDTLRNADQMCSRSTIGLVAEGIRYMCESVSNHGAPVYDHPDLGWCVLSAEFPRLKTTQLGVYIIECPKGGEDFFICRQEIVSENDFISASIPFYQNLVKHPPYYNVFSYPALIWYAFRKYHLDAVILRSKKLLGTITAEEEKALSLLEMKLKQLRLDLSKFLYCTQILYNSWSNFGRNIFKEFFDSKFCTPKEQDLLCKTGRYKYIAGYCKMTASDQMWVEVMNHV